MNTGNVENAKHSFNEILQIWLAETPRAHFIAVSHCESGGEI